MTRYYIHLYDYELGSAIFESDFFDNVEDALSFAKNCNFYTTENINVELMGTTFYGEDLDYTYFIRNLDNFEYGRI